MYEVTSDVMNDYERIAELLIIGDYFGDVDEVLSRHTQKFNENNRIIELDLSGLGLDELSPTITELDQLKVLNIADNEIEYLPLNLTELRNLENLIIGGNPLERVPPLNDKVEVDKSLPSYSEEEMKRTEIRVHKNRVSRKDQYLLDKTCSWCNKAAGYRKEVQRSDSKWGFTTHVSVIMVCNNCSYMHQFYSGRSLFDFE